MNFNYNDLEKTRGDYSNEPDGSRFNRIWSDNIIQSIQWHEMGQRLKTRRHGEVHRSKRINYKRIAIAKLGRERIEKVKTKWVDQLVCTT